MIAEGINAAWPLRMIGKPIRMIANGCDDVQEQPQWMRNNQYEGLRV